MIQILQDIGAQDMLVRKDVGERVDGSARDAGGSDLLGPLVSGPLAELFLQLRDQGLPVAHPVGVGRVALVLGQLGTAYGFAQVGELGVVADGHDEGFIGGVEGLIWNYRGVGIAYQADVLAAHQVLLPAVGEPAEGRLEERNLDARALSGHGAPVEGGQDRIGCEKAAYYVRDGHPDLRRLAIRLARDAHDTTPGLHQEVVAGTILIWSWAEARYGAVDEARVRLFQRLVAQAELLQGSAPPVLDHDVGPGRQRLDPLQPFLAFEVDPDRTLVAVDGEEIRRLAEFPPASEGRAPVAGVVPPLGVLDLQDVGAQVAEHHRRVRSGQNPREVEDPDAFERQPLALFHATSVAQVSSSASQPVSTPLRGSQPVS